MCHLMTKSNNYTSKHSTEKSIIAKLTAQAWNYLDCEEVDHMASDGNRGVALFKLALKNGQEEEARQGVSWYGPRIGVQESMAPYGEQ